MTSSTSYLCDDEICDIEFDHSLSVLEDSNLSDLGARRHPDLQSHQDNEFFQLLGDIDVCPLDDDDLLHDTDSQAPREGLGVTISPRQLQEQDLQGEVNLLQLLAASPQDSERVPSPSEGAQVGVDCDLSLTEKVKRSEGQTEHQVCFY